MTEAGEEGAGAEFEIQMRQRAFDHNIRELRKTRSRKSKNDPQPISQ